MGGASDAISCTFWRGLSVRFQCIIGGLDLAKRPDPRLSHQGLQVLRVFYEQPKESFAGADIWRRTGIIAGTLYPILMRFERAGWLESEWEQLNPSEAG
jgi:DNA-binding MarR family transcriptional regulator